MNKYNTIALGIFFSFMLCFTSSVTYAQKGSAPQGGSPKSWGIGLRLGDPTGITIKKYFGTNKAIEFNVGRTNFFGSPRRYDESFDKYYYDKYPYRYDEDFYKDYKGWNKGYYGSNYKFRAFSFQLHYLVHKDIKAVSGLRWYFGFGPQLKLLHYSYEYFDTFGRPVADSYISPNVGLDGLIGVEYTFASVPLSVFTDAGLYMEIFREPFLVQGLIGIGIRYNF